MVASTPEELLNQLLGGDNQENSGRSIPKEATGPVGDEGDELKSGN